MSKSEFCSSDSVLAIATAADLLSLILGVHGVVVGSQGFLTSQVFLCLIEPGKNVSQPRQKVLLLREGLL